MDLRTAYEKIEHSSPTARRVRSHTARTCKEIAEDLHGILKQYAENETSCGIATSDVRDAEERREWHSEDAKFQSSGNTCVLIVDRTVDPLATLLFASSAHGLLFWYRHDILGSSVKSILEFIMGRIRVPAKNSHA